MVNRERVFNNYGEISKKDVENSLKIVEKCGILYKEFEKIKG